jgi:hypothetical protein
MTSAYYDVNNHHHPNRVSFLDWTWIIKLFRAKYIVIRVVSKKKRRFTGIRSFHVINRYRRLLLNILCNFNTRKSKIFYYQWQVQIVRVLVIRHHHNQRSHFRVPLLFQLSMHLVIHSIRFLFSYTNKYTFILPSFVSLFLVFGKFSLLFLV